MSASLYLFIEKERLRCIFHVGNSGRTEKGTLRSSTTASCSAAVRRADPPIIVKNSHNLGYAFRRAGSDNRM